MGSIIKLSSSTSPSASRVVTRLTLPQINKSPPSWARNAAMSVTAFSGDSNVVFHVMSSWVSVRDATYFLDRVHLVGVRVTGPLGPRRRHPLPRAPAEQQGLRRVHPFTDCRLHHLGVEVRNRPTAVGEAPVGVLLGAARCLHDTVEAHELVHYDSHRSLLRLGGSDLSTWPGSQIHRACIACFERVEDSGLMASEGRDARKLSRFRDAAAQRRFLTAYDAALTFWPAPPTHIDVETRYGTTHVLSSGASTGTPIVLLHAVAVASPAWFADIAALSEDHPVYAIDTITDAGRSKQHTRVRDADDLALWLDDVLAALDLDRVHLVGLSYGGWLALNQARHSPDRLAGITSIDPPGAIGGPRASFVVKMVPDGILAKFAKSEKALHRLLRLLNNGVLPAQPLLDLSVLGLRTFRAKQPFPKRMTDEELRCIHTPALLLFGERSPVNHARRAGERSRMCIPNAETEVVPDAGHMLPVEQPELFTRRVLSFINDIDARDSTL